MNFEHAARLLVNAPYRFAKTMPQNPHYYTLRKQWKDDEFVCVVKYIRKHGYERRFYSKTYISLNVNEWYYWTMGEPINKDGKPWTILINRALNPYRMAKYNEAASTYDSLFESDKYKEEDKKLFDIVGYKKGESILDIGCGTGLFLRGNIVDPKDYLGIDISSGMLNKLHEEFDDYYDGIEFKTIHTKFEDFYYPRMFDKIIALYGTFSYIGAHYVNKVRDYLKPGGKAILMFYANDYVPVTHIKEGIDIDYEPFDEAAFSYCNIYRFGNYNIVEVTK